MSGTEPEQFLAQHNTASWSYSLKAMTVVVVILLPLVLACQARTCYAFRGRISRPELLPEEPATQDARRAAAASEAAPAPSRHGT